MFFKFAKKRVFLDYASATTLRKEVSEIMRTYETDHFANPSALYIEARNAKDLMQKSRAEIGEFLNCAKERIVMTSGGTEGNNIAILGTFEAARAQYRILGKNNPISGIGRPHIISVLTEHPSVREVLDEVTRRGGEVTLLQPNNEGLVTAQQVIDAIKENTVLVSIMYVNNEIGVLQPVREIAQAIKQYRKNPKYQIQNTNYPLLHTDACQAALFYTLDVSTLGVDLLTLDGLKCGGPRNTGVLYIKNGVEILPVTFGGGQENGLRSGTENVAGIIGMAKALSLAKTEHKELSERLEKLRDYFIEKILQKFPTVHVNGSKKHRAPNNINVCFENVDAEYLVVALDTYGVSASYSSSCRTLKEDSSSYVIEALDPECKNSSIRFTLGRETTKEDIDAAMKALEKAVAQVKK